MSHFGGGIAPLTQAKEEPGSGPPSNPPSNPPSAPTSRRPSFAHMQMSGQIPGGPGSLSRRSSLASGPRPITRAEFSGPPTPSLLSRAGSPTLPLGSDEAFGGGKAWGDRKQPRHGEFIGSVDCGTTMKECINQAVEKLEWMGWHRDSVKGIGITNQRETTLCWSRSTGKPLCNAIVWDDARTNALVRTFEQKLDEEGIDIDDDEEVAEDADGAPPGVELGTGGEESAFAEQGKVDEGLSTVGKAMQNLGLAGRGKEIKKKRKGNDGLVDITGIRLSTYFSAIKLRWMLDHHKEVHDAYEADDLQYGTVDSWLVYNLTGAKDGGLHIMDVTNASRTLLVSLKTLAWHPPLLRFFGFKPSILPRIVSSAEVYGKIHENMDTPLTGVPIAGIVGDQQAALVGNKCLKRGEAKNTYGTGSFVLFNTGEDIVRSKNGLLTTVAYQAGPDSKPVYALEGSIAVAGSAIKWLRDQLNLIEESGEMDYLAGSVEDTGGVYFVTAFSGLLAPYWDRDATGTIIGLTSYTTSAHLARATLEAVCFQTRAVLDVIESESGVKLETLKVDGGVTNSDLAMQLQANIGGFNVARPSMRESTALGSALLAGHALKLFGWDLAEPNTLDKVNTADVHTFEPELPEKDRLKAIKGWERAVSRARKWHTSEEEDEEEDKFEEESGVHKVY
ncbi:Glycerol kinase [Saitozyma podzolica]|uniref:glycerol kinase n=1 Tax=Saitozyma podzolica TaxID=1890683 RepID=A0A427YEB8_9TREE|nr:Glycerol kinase [Saitozyma podzolica]